MHGGGREIKFYILLVLVLKTTVLHLVSSSSFSFLTFFSHSLGEHHSKASYDQAEEAPRKAAVVDNRKAAASLRHWYSTCVPKLCAVDGTLSGRK